MVRSLSPFLALAGLVLVSSCASYTDENSAIRAEYRAARYDEALLKLEASDLKDRKRDRLLYVLEKASILDRLGKEKEARSLWLQADKIADELYTTSVSQEALSYVYNDSASEYPGEDYEKVAIHVMLALSFLGSGELNAASVEARKINNKINEINSRLGDSPNRYAEDAFSRYIAGMIHEAKGDIDSAIVDYNLAIKGYDSLYKGIYGVSPPDSLILAQFRLLDQRNRNEQLKQLKKKFTTLWDRYQRTQGKPHASELVVIHEVGSTAIKVSESIVVPFQSQIMRISFPTVRPQSASGWFKTGVGLDDARFQYGERAQDFDRIAQSTLDDKRARILLKSTARLFAKYQLTRQASENLGPIGWLAGNIYNVATETADTRSWTLLPSAIYISRIPINSASDRYQVRTNGKLDWIGPFDPGQKPLYFVRARS